MSTSVIIMSCDKNKDIIQPFLKLYKKYWKHNYNTYIVTETANIPFNKTIKTQGSWTSRVRQALEHMEDEHIIFLLDDFFIRKEVDNDKIQSIINSFDDNTAVFNLEQCYDDNDMPTDIFGFKKRQNKSNYMCSCQPSIWNRQILIKYLQKDMTPHEWELQILDTKYKHYINAGELIIDIGYSASNRTHWGLVQGKWTEDIRQLFEKENIQVDYSKREWFGEHANCHELKLSIIIPYYNTLSYTKELLNILIPQLNEQVEVIIVDDGCNEKELDQFTDVGIMVIHKENKGVSSARNKGLDTAKGKYIAFIDSDDKISDKYIERILNKINESEFDYCTMSWRGIGRIQGKFIITNDPPEWNTSVWNCVYNKNLIGNTRFREDIQIGEDEEFNKIRKGKRANITEIQYIYYTERTDNLTGRYMHNEITREVSDKIKSQLIVYQKYVSKIGGVETWLYEFFKEYSKKYEILFIYKEADNSQLLRYKKFIRCVRFNNQKFECNKYICASNQDNIAENIDSIDNFYGLIIQADYEAMNWTYRQHPKTNVHIAVSEVAKNGCKKYIKDCKIIYNLLNLDKPKKVLNLITATRVSKEKGFEEMKLIAKRLMQLEKNNLWNVFVDNVPNEKLEGLMFRQCVLNDIDYIANSDYYITCAKTESWGYSVAKALALGIPVVAIEYPALYEQGLIDGVNGFIIKKDLSNLDEVIEKMYNSNLKGFKYEKKDNLKQWEELLQLVKKKTEYKYQEPTQWEVKSLVNTYFTEEGVQAKKGDKLIIKSKVRLEQLLGNNDYNTQYVELI
jgi:glycosyltransferase involved in cell wall biosynthesis